MINDSLIQTVFAKFEKMDTSVKVVSMTRNVPPQQHLRASDCSFGEPDQQWRRMRCFAEMGVVTGTVFSYFSSAIILLHMVVIGVVGMAVASDDARIG